MNSNRIQVDLSNAGNLRMESRAHSNEFGARLIQWALEQSGTPLQTGEGGQLAEGAAANPQRRYRVVAFYGCSTNSYDTALRNTEGFGTREADILVTNRHDVQGRPGLGLPRDSSTASSARARPSGCSAA